MRVLTIMHQRDAGPGVFAQAAGGHELVEWVPAEGPPPGLDGIDAAMVFGGGMHADQEDEHPWLRGEKDLLRRLLADGTPVLGVCLGGQLLVEAVGGRAARASQPEIGWHDVELAPDAAADPLLGPLPDRLDAFGWHSYEFSPPDGATRLAWSAVCLQACRLAPRSWALQFHAEVTHEIVHGWLDNYGKDEDAVRAGIDPDAIRSETSRRIESWNEVGRGIAARFHAAATPA